MKEINELFSKEMYKYLKVEIANLMEQTDALKNEN